MCLPVCLSVLRSVCVHVLRLRLASLVCMSIWQSTGWISLSDAYLPQIADISSYYVLPVRLRTRHLKWWLAGRSTTRHYLATDSCFVNIHGRRCRPIAQPLVMISDGCCRRGLHVASLFLENYFSKISGQLVHIVHIVYGMVYQLTHNAVHAGTVNIVGTKVCQYSWHIAVLWAAHFQC